MQTVPFKTKNFFKRVDRSSETAVNPRASLKNVTVVNRALSSLNGTSLKITMTVF